MSVINALFEETASAPSTPIVPVVITWTSNEPTPSDAQTIADGDLVAGTELGQAIKNLNTKIDQLIVDNNAMRALINS